MFNVQPEQPVRRNATAYARVQPINKKFMEAQAKNLGFKSAAAYVDAVLTKIRLETKTTVTTKKAAKKPYKVKRK